MIFIYIKVNILYLTLLMRLHVLALEQHGVSTSMLLVAPELAIERKAESQAEHAPFHLVAMLLFHNDTFVQT